jgi:uncharacterized membrane protein HdeD (DUF308 family)
MVTHGRQESWFFMGVEHMNSEAALRAQVRDAGRWWWVFIVTGLIWLWISLVVLRFTETSVATVGILIGVVFTLAAITEFMVVGVTSGGWKIVHLILAVIFVLGAIWGYANPKDAFWALAEVLGFLLVIYGAIELTEAVATRQVNPMWWLGLIVGILLILLGFWTGQQLLVVKAQLLIFYVGLAALFRGIGQIVFAFRLRHAGNELAAP